MSEPTMSFQQLVYAICTKTADELVPIVGVRYADDSMRINHLAELAYEADPDPAARPQEGWQPIETAPEATPVLIRVPNYGIHVGLLTKIPPPDVDAWFIRGDAIYRVYPTHWMPLPLPPLTETRPPV